MKKKELTFLFIILFLVLFVAWLWTEKSKLQTELNNDRIFINQFQLMSGIGPLASTHQHVDVKVYISGHSIDFSQHKYQLATNYIHFEDGHRDVIHLHATGLTTEHMLNSVKINFRNNCLMFEDQNYCDGNGKTIKFYVNGKLRNDLGTYVMNDLDKILVTYGDETPVQIQKQLDSITDLAPKYSSASSKETD